MSGSAASAILNFRRFGKGIPPSWDWSSHQNSRELCTPACLSKRIGNCVACIHLLNVSKTLERVPYNYTPTFWAKTELHHLRLVWGRIEWLQIVTTSRNVNHSAKIWHILHIPGHETSQKLHLVKSWGVKAHELSEWSFRVLFRFFLWRCSKKFEKIAPWKWRANGPKEYIITSNRNPTVLN